MFYRDIYNIWSSIRTIGEDVFNNHGLQLNLI